MNSPISKDSKLIVYNTFFLYTRLFFVTIISLYTSRIILFELGVEDFGIYNLVGGIVFILGIMQSIMSSAISRYFMIEVAKENILKLNKYFSMSILMLVPLALFVILMSETFGLWFLNNKLLIPQNRLHSSNYVYQLSIVAFVINLFMIPFMSLLIAHEKMKIYAYIGIIEIIMKLLIAYSLSVVESDKLIIYSILSTLVVLLIFTVNYIYCKTNFKQLKFYKKWNNSIFNEMFQYSIWSLFGAISTIIKNQGINMLLGVFFNPVINAARAIAYQVSEGINQFSNNFFSAVRPQITKRFAKDEKDNMLSLVLISSKLSYYLILIIALPVIFELKYILNLWLGRPPIKTELFTRLVIITALIETLAYPLITAINATGKIKNYQIITGSILIFTLPASYLFLKLDYPPESTMYVSIIIAILAQISRLIFMKLLHNFPILLYFKEVILIVILVTVFSSIIPLIIINFYPSSYYRFLLIICLTIINIIVFIYYIGLSKVEKNLLKNIITHLKLKYFK